MGEEGLKLLQYCSWENPQFSQSLLSELLWHCGFAYWHDMRHHTEILLQILLIEDSWQNHRIHNALIGNYSLIHNASIGKYCFVSPSFVNNFSFSIISGLPEDREGLFEIIQRNRINYQKRAYQCIKCMVHLFRKSSVALSMLHGNPAIGRAWSNAVEWLHEELERQRNVANQYNYNSWSPPVQSNESTNSFTLERSVSAKNILQLAIELCRDVSGVAGINYFILINYLSFVDSRKARKQDWNGIESCVGKGGSGGR